MRKPIADAKRAEFCISCRKVRLWLAQNPGATSFEIRKAHGARSDSKMSKMLGMGIVKCETHFDELGGRAIRWFVVPQ